MSKNTSIWLLMTAIGAIALCEIAMAAPPLVPKQGRWLEPRLKPLSVTAPRRLVRRGDGTLLTVVDNEARVSKDNGQTWTKLTTIVEGPGPGIPGGSLLLKTRGGVVVLIYVDISTMRRLSHSKAPQPEDNARRDVWAVRSLDDGKTWADQRRLLQGYCGALFDIIETSDGKIVVPVQRMLYNPGRGGTATFVSPDQGKTWRESNLIDIGGQGHHDGAVEGTLVELKDGRLWMLLRTNRDRFWQAFSSDGGLTWDKIGPSEIDASSSPGHLKRLASRRLVLVWNRLYPEGKNTYFRRGGLFTATPGSWHREELSIAFSEDDGKTWSKPVVIARKLPAAVTARDLDRCQMAYPFIFEARPGELWICVAQTGKFWIQLKENNFPGADNDSQARRK